jgi:hypothetical protein
LKYKLIISLLTILFLLAPVLIKAQNLSFFPYQMGDILVYQTFDFDSNYLKDIQVTIAQDSIGEDGKRYLSSFLLGQQYSIDSLGNIYSNDYYGIENSRIFDSSTELNEPWILAKREAGSFELAIKREVLSIERFSVQDTLVLVEYYSAPDSLSTSGLSRSEVQWSINFGLVATFDAEGGNRHSLKGGVFDGLVYGDTTVYTPPPPWEIQKDYFPYKDGDILIYSVQDSLGNSLLDSKFTLAMDSVDNNGSIWYSLDSKGSASFASQIIVDTLRNVYGTSWWNDNKEPWKIYNAYNAQSRPWVVFKSDGIFELGMVLGIEIRSVFGRNFGIDRLYNVFTINYYSANDSTTQAFDDYQGEFRSYAEWSKEFGIFHKYDFDTGLTYDLKGGVLNGFAFGDTVAVITSDEIESQIPYSFKLHQNYPNPFNPSTTIQFELTKPTYVSLNVYTIHGQLVHRLISNQYYNIGTHSTKLNVLKQGGAWASGLYFYELKTDFESQIKPMTLIK